MDGTPLRSVGFLLTLAPLLIGCVGDDLLGDSFGDDSSGTTGGDPSMPATMSGGGTTMSDGSTVGDSMTVGIDESGTDTSPTASASATSTTMTSADESTDSGSTGSGSTDTGGSTDGSSTGGSTGGPTSAGSSGTGGATPACVAYGETLFYCYGGKYSEQYYEDLCEAALEYYYENYGAGCAAAFEDLFACIASLSCAELALGNGCEAEGDAVTLACGF